MRNRTTLLMCVASLAWPASSATASLGTSISNLVMDKPVLCLHNDFTYLHKEVADFLEHTFGAAVASFARESETDELPALLREFHFFDEAKLVEQEIRRTTYYCVVRQ